MLDKSGIDVYYIHNSTRHASQRCVPRWVIDLLEVLKTRGRFSCLANATTEPSPRLASASLLRLTPNEYCSIGEIISPDTGTVFYNYFGDGLPDDLVTPIDFVVTKRINGSMQEFEFRIEGTNIKTYGTNGSRGDNWRYYAMWDVNKITKLTISSIDGSIMQEFSDLETANEWFNEEKPYGLSFDDWNFDGYLDVSLWKHPGGTSGNYPHYYWLWDNDLGQFVANTQLEEISDDSWIEVDNENYQIVSHSKFSSGHRSKHFEYRSNEFVMVLSEYAGIDMDEWVNGRVIMRTIIEELIDGKIVVIEDNSEDITESYWNNVSGMVRQNGLNNEGLVCYSSGVPFSAFLLGTF